MFTPTHRSTAHRRATSRTGLVVVAALISLLSGLLPAAAAEPDDAALREELERVEAQQEDLAGSLDAATARVDRLAAELAKVRDRADALRGELAELEQHSAQVQKQMNSRLVAMYKGDRTSTVLAIATGGSLTEMTQRSHYLGALTRDDRRAFEQAAALATATQAQRAELAQADEELDGLVAQADQARDELDAQFAAAGDTAADLQTEIERREAEAQRLAEEAAAKRRAAEQAAAEDAERQVAEAEAAERRAAAASRSVDRAREEAAAAPAPAPAPQEQSQPAPAPAGGSSGGGSSSGGSGGSGGSSSGGSGGGGNACPQANPRSFTDTWGAPRSGGRTHQGTDIFGARGGNVYAITSGTVQWTQTGATSGLFLSLRGDDGHDYWYMHLQDFVAGAGDRVSAGDLIAHNGDTGNAQGTTPHIHFEYHPGGGSAVNPYPLLKSICG